MDKVGDNHLMNSFMVGLSLSMTTGVVVMMLQHDHSPSMRSEQGEKLLACGKCSEVIRFERDFSLFGDRRGAVTLETTTEI